MSPDEDIGDGERDRALAGEFVLGLLPAAAHAEALRREAGDPAFRAETELWRRQFSALDGQFAEVAPPAGMLPAIEARLFASPRQPGLWHSLAFWRGLAGAAGAIAVIAIGLNLVRPAPPSPEAVATELVAALEAQGSNVRFLALYDSATGTIRLTGLSGEPVPDRDLELWAIQGGNAPVSMGVIPVNARSQVQLSPEILSGFGEGSVLAITLEPMGGSPTGDPTGPVVAQGTATPI